MDYREMIQALKEIYPKRIATIDSYTAGEPTRLIIGGMGPVAAKKEDARKTFVFHGRLGTKKGKPIKLPFFCIR